MTARVQLQKISARESQGSWRQNELNGGKPTSRKATLTLTLTQSSVRSAGDWREPARM
jgi:hypothetical protein